jgi:hypothetical protein
VALDFLLCTTLSERPRSSAHCQLAVGSWLQVPTPFSLLHNESYCLPFSVGYCFNRRTVSFTGSSALKVDEADFIERHHHGVLPALALLFCLGALCGRCFGHPVLDSLQCRSQVLSGGRSSTDRFGNRVSRPGYVLLVFARSSPLELGLTSHNRTPLAVKIWCWREILSW